MKLLYHKPHPSLTKFNIDCANDHGILYIIMCIGRGGRGDESEGEGMRVRERGVEGREEDRERGGQGAGERRRGGMRRMEKRRGREESGKIYHKDHHR